jgi:diguanylate cyclase (GGDEF)-like protein
LLFDRQHRLWIDTAVAGLHRMSSWDGRLASFDRISQRHGRLGQPFGANLLQDARGRIWSQMHVYDPALDRLDELTPTDGVAFGTGWFYAYAKTGDGRLLFGGSKGLLVVEPAGFDFPDFAPPLVVSELRVNGLRQPAGRIGQGLTLGPQDRSFSVEFAALDYSDPRRLHYAYRLVGFDPEPIATSADSRLASYSNLDPGDYELQVSATNRNGRWSEHMLRVPLHRLPAWWQTGWFRAAAALASIALLAGLLRWHTRQLRRRQSALEQKVQERTATLETLTLALQLESAALQESSLTDPLTGLRNRRFLTQHIDADVAQVWRRHESPLAPGAALADDADLVFFLIDIDHFKQVNDLHGHAAGDAVLVQICQRLRKVFREADYLVRWGGEEFLVVARHTARAHAAGLAGRACAAVAEQPFVLDDGTLVHKTCSIGFSAFPIDPRRARLHDWHLTVNVADAALYAAKQAGRNAWLGLVSARADSLPALQALLRRPVADWRQDAAMTLAGTQPDEVTQAPPQTR